MHLVYFFSMNFVISISVWKRASDKSPRRKTSQCGNLPKLFQSNCVYRRFILDYFPRTSLTFSETFIRNFSETLFFDHLPGLLADFLLLMSFAEGLVGFMLLLDVPQIHFAFMLELKVRLPEFKVVFVSQVPEFTDYSCRTDSEGNIWTL